MMDDDQTCPEQVIKAKDIPNFTRIEAKDVPDFIRANFGKIRGTLSCSNPHWWLHFGDGYIVYEYKCCDYEDCGSQDYEKYSDPELLLLERHGILTDGDDWWWCKSKSAGWLL